MFTRKTDNVNFNKESYLIIKTALKQNTYHAENFKDWFRNNSSILIKKWSANLTKYILRELNEDNSEN